MSTIIDKLKNSITSTTGLPFYYDTPQTLNERLDRGKFPAAMLNILNQNAVLSENGILRERLTIEMIFVTENVSRPGVDALDFDGEWVETNELDKMKRLAFQWLLGLYRSHDLHLVAINGTNRYYATDDVIYDAYGVNVTLDEIAGVSKCDFKKTEQEPGEE